ncbi:outer membrane receptor protein involved in Fe transport [Sphingobium sp. B2D3A]|uniref:TonB-dependent receptor n=1 Tax=unclassified Sphingobium TaxID=2611147 RepID=UPI0022253D7D|nr:MULTISPECIES: TonB-dependent receptor [unclassified Sphingobium]MCW2338181.1 outer membrane receptor protein involved in Fe transport [Sphingobium sp. B2D3A]MCW2384640.1 outer membrane receptor protein involved in Fe transport [Sphingobium sp. B2D3D]
MKTGGYGRGALLAAAAMAALCYPQMAAAQDTQQRYDIEATALGDALNEVSRQAGVEVIFSADAVAGRSARPLHGTFSAKQAIDRILEGTGLQAEYRDGGYVVRRRSGAPGKVAGRPAEASDIIVTGSRIRGGEPSAPVISATRSAIEQRGLSDLGDYIRQLPQNFGGGQNPGVFSGGGQGGSSNLNSSSSLNLRGLGPDASLTLLNGHRVAYDGVSQGVDISAIPLAAIDRVEIIADGSSALYGSDAVGGVANVVLRKSFTGFSTSAKVLTTTDGGGTGEQLTGVAGKSWQSGNVLAIVDYQHSNAITAGQRSFVTGLNRSATLIPGEKEVSSIVSVGQQIGPNVHFAVDGQYGHRWSSRTIPYALSVDAFMNGTVIDSQVETFSVNPSVTIQLPHRWELTVMAGYGESITNAPGLVYRNGTVTLRNQVRYRNTIADAEAYAEGPFAMLPGGDARLVVGGGYRSSKLIANSSQTVGARTTPVFDFDKSHQIAFGYAEASLPLVGHANQIPLISQLTAIAAVRYENYRAVGDFLAPKLGAIYAPISSIKARFSWGKSFKAPTLYSQYRGYQATLLPASFFGASSAPMGSAIVYTGGANANLTPEKSENWTASVEVSPAAIRGLKIGASYFHILYSNRVSTPIGSLLGALSNPLYSSFVTFSPSALQIDALSGDALFGLENFTGAAYNPASVYAIVQNVSQNIARQKISGLDLSISYAVKLGARDAIHLQGAATYLKSERQLLSGLSYIDLAGTIFNPPHWRSEGGVSWTHGEFTVSSFANYIGGTLDNRLSPFVDVESFLSIDLTAQWRLQSRSGPLRGVEFAFSGSNLFNRRPGYTRTTSTSDPSFDTTNYPANGRTLSFTMRKTW